LHIRRWEHRGDVVRVEFVCGGRALRELRWKNAALGRLAASLSVGADEVEAVVARLREAEERARKGLERATGQLLAYEAGELLRQAAYVGTLRVVRRAFEGRGLDEVRALARAIAAGGGVALLGLRAEKAHLLFARADGLAIDCGTLLRAVLAPFGGRGGGQPGLAQGGLPDGSRLEDALDAAVEHVRAVAN
jgi:alanyl-tRNA synthetase